MNNEKKIYLNHFKNKVSDGDVRFLIVDAKYDNLKSKKGDNLEIVKLTIEVHELNGSEDEKEIKNINLFVNYTPEGSFYKFVKAALDVIKSTAFTPSLLIGLKGQAVMSHYKPEGLEFAFTQMNDWVFYASSQRVDEALEKYINDDDNTLGFDGEEGEETNV